MGKLRRFGSKVARFLARKGWSEPPFWELDKFRTGLLSTTPDRERIENDFEGYVHGAYKSDGVVFACALARQMIFSEARFQWTRFVNGQRGDLFGSPDLALLEEPWPGGTTGELLARMDVDVAVAGNFYATVVDDAGRAGRAANGPGRRISHLRPDWVTILLESASGDPYAADTKIVGYMYDPPLSGLRSVQAEPLVLLPSEVCHYSPHIDPAARFRGMSWLTPIIREIAADRAATGHKLKFFENGATLQTVMKLDASVTPEQFDKFVERFRKQHEGADNAYRTLFVGGGADATVVGTDLKQLDFRGTQGAGETRIAAASGMHPAIVGLAEALQGSTLNTGNFTAARRLTADKTLRPLWRMAAASLQTILAVPAGARLWFDDRDIAFLRDDQTDVADIQQKQAIAIRSLVDAGYDPDAAVEYVRTNDLGRLLRRHTGLYSVQLQPPGTEPTAIEASTNGSANGREVALTR